MEITDSNGFVVESYAYSAFGMTSIFDESGDSVASSTVNNRYGYTGREIENDGMYYYRARY